MKTWSENTTSAAVDERERRRQRATPHAGAANGKRRRASSGRTTSAVAGAANHGVRSAPRAASLPEGHLERALDRGEHDQRVEAVARGAMTSLLTTPNVLRAARAVASYLR